MMQVFLFLLLFFYTDYSKITAMPNYYYTTYNLSAVDFVCSNYSYSLSDCNFTATSDYSCQSHVYDAYLTCAIGMGYTSQ